SVRGVSGGAGSSGCGTGVGAGSWARGDSPSTAIQAAIPSTVWLLRGRITLPRLARGAWLRTRAPEDTSSLAADPSERAGPRVPVLVIGRGGGPGRAFSGFLRKGFRAGRVRHRRGIGEDALGLLRP